MIEEGHSIQEIKTIIAKNCNPHSGKISEVANKIGYGVIDGVKDISKQADQITGVSENLKKVKDSIFSMFG